MLPPSRGDVPKLYEQALGLQRAGDNAAALEIYRRLLLTVPNQPEVLFQLGRLEAEAGRLEAAEAALQKARSGKPKEPAIWQALHGVLKGAARTKLEREAGRAGVPLGLAVEAKPIFRLLDKGDTATALKRAIALARMAPIAPAPAHALGAAQSAVGNWPAAVAALEAAVTRDPANAEAHVLLAGALQRMERPMAALSHLDTADGLGAKTARPRARILSAIVRFEDAADVLVAKAGTAASAEHHHDLARARAILRDVAGARAAFGAALKARLENGQRPRAKPLRQSLAATLADAGEIEAAVAFISEGLAETPDDADLLTQRGQLRQTLGAFEAADDDLRRAIETAPQSGLAYRAYVNGRKTTPDDPVCTALGAARDRVDLPAPERRALSFAAAKCAADRKDTEAEIGHLARANRLVANAYPYGFQTDLDTARAYAADWEALRDLPDDEPKDPVLFVTGLPRSGTTLVESILDAHPQVTAAGELSFGGDAIQPALEGLRNGMADAGAFAEAGRRYLTAARRVAGTQGIVADKAIATFLRTGHLAKALPGARFIMLRRDLRDTGLSLWRNVFPDGMHRYAYDQVQMARYMRLHEALVSFWAERLPDRVLVLDYEALTAAPNIEIPKLVAFCGLPWDPACLTPESNRRSVATLSFAQVRQPIGQGSVAGWKRMEAGLKDLLAELDRTEPPDLRPKTSDAP